MEVLVVTWLLFAIVVAVAANSRGRSGIAWFVIAVLISPLLALILVLVMPNEHHEEARSAEHAARLREHADTKVCPRCAERIKRAAQVCRFCGHEFSAEEVAAATAPPERVPEPRRGNHAMTKAVANDRYNGTVYVLHADGTVVAGIDGTPHTWPDLNEFQRWVDARLRAAV